MIGLDQRATVYAEDNSTGLYDTPLKSNLKCRMVHVKGTFAATGNERAELAGIRHVLWEPSYVMPENAQIAVDGIRWQLRPGTFSALRGPSGQVTVRVADAVRQL